MKLLLSRRSREGYLSDERRERRFVEESEVWIEEIRKLNFIRVDFPLDFLIEMKKNK